MISLDTEISQPPNKAKETPKSAPTVASQRDSLAIEQKEPEKPRQTIQEIYSLERHIFW